MRHGEGGGQEEVATNGVLWGRGSSGEELRLDGPIFYRVNDDNTGPELFMEVSTHGGLSVLLKGFESMFLASAMTYIFCVLFCVFCVCVRHFISLCHDAYSEDSTKQ